jgi:tripartite-type tricarboxylate transporter receptor subunit TctC
MQKAGVKVSIVPTDDGGERMASVIANHVDLMYEEVSAVGDMVKSGNLKPLVILRDERINSPELKDTPCAGEIGIKGMGSYGTWRAFFFRKGTPQECVTKMEAALKQVYDSADYQKMAKDNDLDLTPGWMNAQQLGALVKENKTSFTQVFKTLGRIK